MPEYSEPLIAGECYHIYNRAVGNDDVFRNTENYKYFLNKYREHVEPVADTYAYCLMPNHFHFLVKIKEEVASQTSEVFKTSEVSDASKKFSNLFNANAKAYNKRFERHGALFSHRFKRKAVSTNDYFIEVVRYIHFNPVHHGFAGRPGQWKFSSWHSFFSNKSTSIKLKEVIDRFDDFENFKFMHQTPPAFNSDLE